MTKLYEDGVVMFFFNSTFYAFMCAEWVNEYLSDGLLVFSSVEEALVCADRPESEVLQRLDS